MPRFFNELWHALDGKAVGDSVPVVVTGAKHWGDDWPDRLMTGKVTEVADDHRAFEVEGALCAGSVIPDARGAHGKAIVDGRECSYRVALPYDLERLA